MTKDEQYADKATELAVEAGKLVGTFQFKAAEVVATLSNTYATLALWAKKDG